jgi:hypothetical protein
MCNTIRLNIFEFLFFKQKYRVSLVRHFNPLEIYLCGVVASAALSVSKSDNGQTFKLGGWGGEGKMSEINSRHKHSEFTGDSNIQILHTSSPRP